MSRFKMGIKIILSPVLALLLYSCKTSGDGQGNNSSLESNKSVPPLSISCSFRNSAFVLQFKPGLERVGRGIDRGTLISVTNGKQTALGPIIDYKGERSLGMEGFSVTALDLDKNKLEFDLSFDPSGTDSQGMVAGTGSAIGPWTSNATLKFSVCRYKGTLPI